MKRGKKMQTSRDERNAAAEVAKIVFEGIAKGDSALCRDCYLEDAVLVGETNGKLNLRHYAQIFEQMDATRPEAGFNYRTDVVAMDENIAMVRVQENNYNGNYYTVYLTEIKLNGRWKIASFVYNHDGRDCEQA